MYELHFDSGVIRDGYVSDFEDYYDTVKEFDNLKSKFSTSSWGGTRIR